MVQRVIKEWEKSIGILNTTVLKVDSKGELGMP